MPRLPTLFISHGSPMLAIRESPAHRFLLTLGATMPRPSAILVASAHWESPGEAAVSLAPQPETIHDFRVDLIVTPDETIWCTEPHRPPGILWEHLDQDKIAKVPALAALAAGR